MGKRDSDLPHKKVASGIIAACSAVATTVVGMIWPTLNPHFGIPILITCGVGVIAAIVLWFWPVRAPDAAQIAYEEQRARERAKEEARAARKIKKAGDAYASALAHRQSYSPRPELIALQQAAREIYSEFRLKFAERMPTIPWDDPGKALGLTAHELIKDGLIPIWGIYPPSENLVQIPDEDARTYQFSSEATEMFDAIAQDRRYKDLQIARTDFERRRRELRSEYASSAVAHRYIAIEGVKKEGSWYYIYLRGAGGPIADALVKVISIENDSKTDFLPMALRTQRQHEEDRKGRFNIAAGEPKKIPFAQVISPYESTPDSVKIAYEKDVPNCLIEDQTDRVFHIGAYGGDSHETAEIGLSFDENGRAAIKLL